MIGKTLYSKVAGYDSVLPDAVPLREDMVLKFASTTKLITSVALLQCIENGLIGLDDSLTKVLPEFDGRDILKDVVGSELKLEKSTTPLTARHLLTQTSGLGYPFLNPLLGRRERILKQERTSNHVTEKYDLPLTFEPGTGWQYGCNLDWAGVAVSRLNGGMTLEDYFVENVWKRVGLSAPFPTFNIERRPEYDALKMKMTFQAEDGRLEHLDRVPFDDPVAQNGGEGLAGRAGDIMAVLVDLISDTPQLLRPETIRTMYTPQLPQGSKSHQMLTQMRPVWEIVCGPIADESLNHGLAGAICLAPVPELKQPANIIGWGGASNNIWWASRELGVAGYFATQQTPFGNPTVTKLANAWKKDFWTQYDAGT